MLVGQIEKISRNKPVIQTPITYFINQKEKKCVYPT